MDTEQKIDRIADDVTTIKIAIARMEEQSASRLEAHERIEERLDIHNMRIDALEKRPGRWWEKLMGAILGAATVGIVAWIVDQLRG